MGAPNTPTLGSVSTTRIVSAISTPLVVTSVVFPVLAATSIYLRLLAKRWGRQPYHADDWWVIATWFLTIPMSILFWFYASKSGVDASDIDIVQGTQDSLMVGALTGCLLQVPLSSVKISVLLFYKRIFSISRKLVVCVWVAIGIIAAWCIVFTGLMIAIIEPLVKSDYIRMMRWDLKAVGRAQLGSSIALDIIVLCFPLPIVFRMLLSPKKKLMVFGMFWLGAFCCIAAVVRLALLEESVQNFDRSPKSVYRESTQYIFMLIEPNCSIIAACLPCYGPFISKARDLTAKSERNSGNISSKGTWASSTHERPCMSKPGSQVQLNARYHGWPRESRSDRGSSNGERALST